MSDLPTPISLNCRSPVTHTPSYEVVTKTAKRLDSQNQPNRAKPKIVTETKPKIVTETEYWENYYENSDRIYEWNNGILEEKAVSDKETTSMYGWLFELTGYYLKTYPIGERIYLETGFRMALPHKTTIRRPDFGVILYNNPVAYHSQDNSYKGICNLCIEAISDSNIERDTQTKFLEYEAAGVQEYYLLYSKGFYQEFYYLNQQGVYVPLPRIQGDLIQSKVLSGFQFRISDLHRKPSVEEMIDDPVYQGFVLPGYRDAKQRAEAEKKRAEAAEMRAEVAETQAMEERKARQLAEAQVMEERKARQKARQEAEDRIKLLEAELARLSKR